MIDVTRILNVGSLSAFIEEVPAGSTVRVEVSDVMRRNSVNVVTSTLTIHGGGRTGELVELRYSMHGFDFSSKSRAGQMLTVAQLVREYLAALGFDVRSGRYAVPDNLVRLEGVLECIEWRRGKEQHWVVEPSEAYRRVVAL